MNNTERLAAIGKSLTAIGKDLKCILSGFFCQHASNPPITGPQSAPASTAIPGLEPHDPEASKPLDIQVQEPGEALAADPEKAVMLHKACSRCKIEKPLDVEHFHRDSHKPSGFRSACRECSNGAAKQIECKSCRVSKPLSPQFWQRNSKAKSGFRNPCKECLKKAKAA